MTGSRPNNWSKVKESFMRVWRYLIKTKNQFSNWNSRKTIFEEHTKLYISLMLAVAMSCVVKLFNTQQKFYKTLGFDIFLSQSCHSKCLASAKILFFLISSTQLFISTTAYFLFQAQTADEYEISFYISITIFITVINISTIAWKIRKFLTIIERYEDFIDKS